MKGVIFNLLESFICDNWGDEKYEEILDLCPLKTKEPFVGPGTYPDSDLMSITSKAAEILGVSIDEALRSFGQYAFPKLAKRYPNFSDHINSPRDFLLTVDSVIHVEVKKLYPQAETPRFHYEDISSSRLIMSYQSKRQLCPLVEGFIAGVSDFYKTPIHVNHTRCTRQGHSECEFDLQFAG